MTRIVGVVSGKGGVGKTTTVSNLGASLVEQGKDVIILDANITTPNLSLHLGIPFYPVTLHDVLEKRAPIQHAIYTHESGLRIIPASLSVSAIKDVKINKLHTAILNILGQADVIIIDAAAGLGAEAQATINVADEVIVVTNPEIPAVTDALKTIKIAEESGTKVLGVVVNRVKGHSYEMKGEDIKHMLEVPIIAVIPEDIRVPRSISKRMPVVHTNPRSRSSLAFKRLAKRIVGESFVERKDKGWFNRLFSWLS